MSIFFTLVVSRVHLVHDIHDSHMLVRIHYSYEYNLGADYDGIN